MERPIQIGVIGAGTTTRERHLPGFRKIPGVAVAVVCNRSEASSRRVAEACGIPHVARRWQEVAAAPELDAVLIGTWPSLHADATIAALQANKHVLTEARMAATLEEAERMWQAARERPHLVAQVVPAPMSLDVDATVQALLRSGAVGELREITITHTTGASADSSAPLTWRQDETKSGINTLTLGIVYEIVQRWLGEDLAWVVADAAVFTTTRVDPDTGRPHAVRLPESVTVLGRYPSGARFICHTSGVEAGSGRHEIRVNGSRACLRFDLSDGALFRTEIPGERDVAVAIPGERRRGWRVEEDFIASIRTGAPVVLTGFEQGVRYMRFTQAVWESWRAGGRKIPLP